MSVYSHLELAISDYGAEFIGTWEGLELDSYLDVAGVWTIGIGHTRTAGPYQAITEEEAYDLFREDVARYVEAINELVSVPLTQRQYDALVSLCFNIGIGGFKGSTVRRRLNAGDYRGAADAFVMWNKARDQGRLRAVQGLTNRRLAEARLFRSGITA